MTFPPSRSAPRTGERGRARGRVASATGVATTPRLREGGRTLAVSAACGARARAPPARPPRGPHRVYLFLARRGGRSRGRRDRATPASPTSPVDQTPTIVHEGGVAKRVRAAGTHRSCARRRGGSRENAAQSRAGSWGSSAQAGSSLESPDGRGADGWGPTRPSCVHPKTRSARAPRSHRRPPRTSSAAHPRACACRDRARWE